MGNAWTPLFRAPGAAKPSRNLLETIPGVLLKSFHLATRNTRISQKRCARTFISYTHTPPLSTSSSPIPWSPTRRSIQPHTPSRRQFHRTHPFQDERPTLWSAFREFISRQLKDEISGGSRYDGPRFRSRDLSQEEIDGIFGPGIDVEHGNRVVRHMQQRRKDGQIEWDPQVPRTEIHANMEEAALGWLRVKYPMNERAAYQERRRREEVAVQDVIVADAERLGIYKPNSSVSRKASPYGKSVLEEFKEENRRRVKEQEKEQEQKAKEQMKRMSQRLELMKQNTELSMYIACMWMSYHCSRSILIRVMMNRATRDF